MCCLYFSALCQHQHQHQHQHRRQHHQHQVIHVNHHSAVTKLSALFYAATLLLFCVALSDAQIAYSRYLSELRIQELHNMAIRLEHSIDMDKFVCESYFDYVCGRNRPLFSIMGVYLCMYVCL